ncbi:MAG: flagellar hook-basal body complex protein [Phycisphaerales bacterium]|jgi:flagellar hook protein FlgE
MSYALSSGVTGLQAHQQMLDVAGNNIANVNSTAYKSSRVGFAELLSQTLEQASQPTDRVGGTNPQQMGSGVGIAAITPNMTQGSIVSTGNPLDAAIEGEGYFVVSDGEQQLYTRAGAFGVDENGHLVDPATGYLVQRIGLTGETDGFQITGDSNIRVPYDVALPATATTEITLTGNLSSDAVGTAKTQTLASSTTYTTDGAEATGTTQIDQLDQFRGGLAADGGMTGAQSGTITLSGFKRNGTALGAGLTYTVTAGSTLNDLCTYINGVMTDSTASVVNGRIQVADKETGYSKTDLAMSYSGTAGTSLETPPYFELTSVGGNESKNVNIAVYDTQGGKHVLSASLVRSDTINQWDMVLTSMTGNVLKIDPANRRINGLTFDPQSGAFTGLAGAGTAEFAISFTHDPTHSQTLSLNLGTAGSFDGLTQFAGNSTAVARDQNGYEAGSLKAVSISGEGMLIGAFTNGVKKDLATLAIALFRNPAGLQSAGSGYFSTSANSGGAVTTQAGGNGAGTIHGSSLEKSNADVATEFVSLIEAQNGYQANARTIRVANDILRELTSLIR